MNACEYKHSQAEFCEECDGSLCDGERVEAEEKGTSAWGPRDADQGQINYWHLLGLFYLLCLLLQWKRNLRYR